MQTVGGREGGREEALERKRAEPVAVAGCGRLRGKGRQKGVGRNSCLPGRPVAMPATEAEKQARPGASRKGSRPLGGSTESGPACCGFSSGAGRPPPSRAGGEMGEKVGPAGAPRRRASSPRGRRSSCPRRWDRKQPACLQPPPPGWERGTRGCARPSHPTPPHPSCGKQAPSSPTHPPTLWHWSGKGLMRVPPPPVFCSRFRGSWSVAGSKAPDITRQALQGLELTWREGLPRALPFQGPSLQVGQLTLPDPGALSLSEEGRQ